jgi:hypothetical protein
VLFSALLQSSCEMLRYVRPSVLQSACNSATSTGGIFVKFLIHVLLNLSACCNVTENCTKLQTLNMKSCVLV